MIETKRKYYKSSSFKMAVLFTILLSFSTAILGYFIYAYTQGQQIDTNRVAISNDAYELILWLGVACIFFMSLVVAISYFLSFFVVSRINIIAETAKDIMETGDLSRRISIDKRWDDLSNLAYILNDLFARVEQLMQDVRQVSDNIAHDLRTPLTRMRNQLEVMKNNNNEPEKVEKLMAEADGLLQTFNALLRITNIEKGERRTKLEELKLNKIIKDVVELYEPIAEEKGIKITSDYQNISYAGDKDLLFQALANLLDNAIKFSPDGGNINIILEQVNGRPVIEIKDTGVGIDKADKAKVFDRFYRADSSRNSPGSGLGLSLVSAVIKLHKGTIELLDNRPSGLIVKISL
jgi:signal transduction histidine kinase